MNDERLGKEIGQFYRETDAAPPDSKQSARQVTARLTQIPQVKRRRWLPAWLQRPTDRSVSTHAPDDPNPHVTGRTRSMFSPTALITAGALVFASAGALLVAQQASDDGVTPGAEVPGGVLQTVNVMLSPGPAITGSGSYAIEDGVTVQSQCWTPSVISADDPRFDGSAIFCGNDLVHDRAEGGNVELGFTIGHDLYRIETDDGAWQGGTMYAEWVDPESGEDAAAGDFILLAGEGAYDGLYAAMTLGDGAGWILTGVVFEGALPTAPEVPESAE